MEDDVANKMKKALDYADEKVRVAEAALRSRDYGADDRRLRTVVAAALSFRARVQMEYDAAVCRERRTIDKEFEEYKKKIRDDHSPITTSSFIR